MSTALEKENLVWQVTGSSDKQDDICLFNVIFPKFWKKLYVKIHTSMDMGNLQ